MKIKNFAYWKEIKVCVFFICIFAISFGVLYLLDLVPNELQETNITTPIQGTASTTVVNKVAYELPSRIVIDKIGVNAIVQNPTTTNIERLDDLLIHGVVRYPGSGLPGEGNMFFFGHSTGLKIVNNQAYKAFNNLKNLVSGDVILVYAEKNVYTYKVNNVRLADSKDVLVDFSVKRTMLTLSTCNTFGQKQERYVVEADYAGRAPL